jgi:hypothetical protein
MVFIMFTFLEVPLRAQMFRSFNDGGSVLDSAEPQMKWKDDLECHLIRTSKQATLEDIVLAFVKGAESPAKNDAKYF